MTDDDIKALREALANPALHDPDASSTDTWEAVLTLFKSCNKDRVARLLDEIDRLQKARDDKAAELANLQVAFSDWKVTHSTVSLEVENQRLRAELARYAQEAIDDIDSWSGYASPYFQDKHDLEGTFRKWRTRAAGDEK